MLGTKHREKSQTMIHIRNATESTKELLHVQLLLHLHYQLTCIHMAGAFIQLINEVLCRQSKHLFLELSECSVVYKQEKSFRPPRHHHHIHTHTKVLEVVSYSWAIWTAICDQLEGRNLKIEGKNKTPQNLLRIYLHKIRKKIKQDLGIAAAV